MSEFDPALQAWRFQPPALGATVRPAVLGMAAALTAVWYVALVTRFQFDLAQPEHYGLVFNAMLQSLLAGRFDVAPAAIGAEGFLREGRIYSYFGILPALLRLPLLLVPDGLDRDITRISCVIAAGLGAWWQLRAIAAAFSRTGPTALAFALAAGVLLGGPHVQFLRASIYEEVLGWAAAFGALFVLHAMEGLRHGFTARRLALMAGAAGLALLTRVSTGLGLSAGLALLLLVLAWPGGFAPGAWLGALLAARMRPALAILLAALAVTLAINWARWGSPFTVVDLQAHLMNPFYPARMARIAAQSAFNPERLGFGLLYYFAPVWPLYWPGGDLLFGAFQARMVEAELPPASFLLSDPLLMLLAGRFVITWRRQAGNAIALATGLALPALLMLGLVFMNHRYRQEFYPFLLFAALAAPRPTVLPRLAWGLAALGIVSAHGFLWLYHQANYGPADRIVVQSLLRAIGL